MFPFLSNPFLFNSTDDQSDLMLLIYHSAKKCKKTLYNRCTLSVLWIRKLSRVHLYLMEAEVFIKRLDEVFMKQVAAAERALS